MIEALPPGLVLILGALLIPLLPKRLQAPFAVALPVIGMAQLLTLAPGFSHHLWLFDYELTVVRIDRLSPPFSRPSLRSMCAIPCSMRRR